MKSSFQTAYCFICSLITLERTIHLSSYDLKFPSKSVSSFLHGVNSIESSRSFSGSFCLLNHTLLKTLALELLLVLLLVVLTSSSSSSFCSSSIYFCNGRPYISISCVSLTYGFELQLSYHAAQSASIKFSNFGVHLLAVEVTDH